MPVQKRVKRRRRRSKRRHRKRWALQATLMLIAASLGIAFTLLLVYLMTLS